MSKIRFSNTATPPTPPAGMLYIFMIGGLLKQIDENGVVTNLLGTAVTSVNTQTGAVVLAKVDVGLGNVDNTTDLLKPLSTATINALTGKADLVGGNTFTGNQSINGTLAINNSIISLTNTVSNSFDGFFIANDTGIKTQLLQYGSTATLANALVFKNILGRMIFGIPTQTITLDSKIGIQVANPTEMLEIGGTAGVDGIKFPDGTVQTSASAGGGGGPASIVTKTANYTTTNTDDVIIGDATGGAISLTLGATVTGTTHKIKAYTGGGGGGAGWANKANTLTGRERCAEGVVGNKIYVIGGVTSATFVNTNQEYDPALNIWTTKANMPTARQRATAGTVNGKIYVIGGYNGTILNTNEEYDPALNSWTTKVVMPTARWILSASVVNNKIYVIGGYNGSTPLNTNEEYDPALNSWTTKAVMPTARYNIAASTVNGKVYAIGGYSTSFLNTNQEYNPALNSWVTKAVMPTARHKLTSSVVNNKIYCIGGNNGADLNINEEYNPALNSWITATPIANARNSATSSVVNGKIYVIGGAGALNSTEEYTFSTPSAAVTLIGTIDGVVNKTMSINNSALELVYTGTGWIITNNYL